MAISTAKPHCAGWMHRRTVSLSVTGDATGTLCVGILLALTEQALILRLRRGSLCVPAGPHYQQYERTCKDERDDPSADFYCRESHEPMGSPDYIRVKLLQNWNLTTMKPEINVLLV